MTERELRRTAVVIPPKGRAVLCVWAAVPGLLAAPFVFWQGILPGLVFAALWAPGSRMFLPAVPAAQAGALAHALAEELP